MKITYSEYLKQEHSKAPPGYQRQWKINIKTKFNYGIHAIRTNSSLTLTRRFLLCIVRVAKPR